MVDDDRLLRTQMHIMSEAPTIDEGVQLANALVRRPCVPARFLWFRFQRHHWQDLTHYLNTSTHLVWERCEDCGLNRMWFNV